MPLLVVTGHAITCHSHMRYSKPKWNPFIPPGHNNYNGAAGIFRNGFLERFASKKAVSLGIEDGFLVAVTVGVFPYFGAKEISGNSSPAGCIRIMLRPHVEALGPGKLEFFLDFPPAIIVIMLYEQWRIEKKGIRKYLVETKGGFGRRLG